MASWLSPVGAVRTTLKCDVVVRSNQRHAPKRLQGVASECWRCYARGQGCRVELQAA